MGTTMKSFQTLLDSYTGAVKTIADRDAEIADLKYQVQDAFSAGQLSRDAEVAELKDTINRLTDDVIRLAAERMPAAA
jgi:hypothetical protein